MSDTDKAMRSKSETEIEISAGTGACDSEKGVEKSCGHCQSCPGNADNLSRTQFMQGALAVIAACWGAMAMYPIYMYLRVKPGAQDESAKVSSIEVCKESELPAGSGRNFRFGSSPALIIHTEDGQFHAFKAICSHLGCTVQYRADDKDIYCACHGGVYNAETGKNIAGPPPKPLSPLKAEVVGGKIIVSRA